MNFTVMPSLQHIAVVKIAATLLLQDDMKRIMEIAMFRMSDEGMRNEAEDKLIEKVKKLALPEFLKDKITGVFKPMYDEIIIWKNYHLQFTPWSDECSFSGTSDYLHWTSQGKLDRKKTAELWIEGRVLRKSDLYVLALMYCLTEKFQVLSNQPPAYFEFEIRDRLINSEVSQMANYWDFSGNPERYEYALRQHVFAKAVGEANQVAAQYFWDKLEPEDKRDVLIKVVQQMQALSREMNCGIVKEYFGEFMCFLLSKMGEEQQIEVIKLRPYDVLRSLLDWPRQSLFLETVKRTWEFLSVHDYSKLLFTVILRKVNRNYKDCNYLGLFKDVWEQSPVTHKKHVFVKFSCLRPLFGLLFDIKDDQCIQWVLKDSTTEEKMNLICCTQGLKCCEFLIDAQEWELLEYFVRKYVSTKCELKTLKQKLEVISLSQSNLFSEEKIVKLYKLVENYIIK